MQEQRAAPHAPTADWLVGGGQMGELIRSLDWSSSSIGPIASWPQSLRTALGICLSSRFPMAIWWGPGIIQFYNDGYRPFLGAKHPRSMGQRGDECWAEIWDVCGPLYRQVMTTAESTWSADLQLLMERSGYLEETYFTFSYSPIRGEGSAVQGNLITVTETTERVLSERRLRTLRDLGARAMTGKTVEEALLFAAQALEANTQDIPFALLYVVDPARRSARLVASSGMTAGTRASPRALDFAAAGAWPVGEVVASGGSIRMDDLRAVGDLPAEPWGEPPRTALVLPLAVGNEVAGVLVAGVSPRRCLDDAYRSFYDVLGSQVATALSNARTYEEQRKRSEALAEIDRAKTAFFSNVSHEFRTPLTLLLAPVEEMLAKEDDGVPAEQRAQLKMVQRNGQRLLKLVNSLLDFARIEAGRAQASYEPTDIALLTAELASNFHSACERAGLALTVDCPPLAEPAFVDREMWEKVVLNLVSNALKFTFSGEIAVRMRDAAESFELAVRDTGVGIPPEELPRMFERFHRVEATQGRSHEGSGIGLALVHELVKLHGGSIAVESEPGKGATFTVLIPKGSGHLPGDRVKAQAAAPALMRADAYVDEAMSWLPETDAAAVPSAGSKGGRRILLADDNADMRRYVQRLLGEDYDVEAVTDGEAALAAARARAPDLVITDLMMPRLDGFGLIRELRGDAGLRRVPVIALSARAGEEARVEGLAGGADDYLVKPFSARELLVRVETLLRSAEIRRESLEQERRAARLAAIVESSDDAIISKDLGSTIVSWNAGAQRLFGYTAEEAIGRLVTMLMPPDRIDEEAGILARIRRGESVEHYETIRRRKDGTLVDISLSVSPIVDEHGKIVGASKIARDITERKRMEQAARQSEALLQMELADAKLLQAISIELIQQDDVDALYSRIIDAAAAIMRSDFASLQMLYPERGSAGELRLLAFRGFDPQAAGFWEWVRADSQCSCGAALRTGGRFVAPDVEECDFMAGTPDLAICLQTGIRAVQSTPLLSRAGKLVGMISTHWRKPHQPTERDLRLLDILARQAADLMERKAAEQALREADRRKDEFLATLSHELRNPLAPIRNAVELLGSAEGNGELTAQVRGILSRQVGGLVRLVDDLLELSRISRGTIGLQREDVDLADVVASALEASRPVIEAAGHHLEISLPQQPVMLRADPVRMAQIFTNLLNNAAKYTRQGGRIWLTVEPGEHEVAVSVRDNGIGIAPDMLPRVFDMFVQAAEGYSHTGLGIGLSLARSLVQMHGGSIEGRSGGEGQGSEFIVRLPTLASSHVLAAAPRDQAVPVPDARLAATGS